MRENDAREALDAALLKIIGLRNERDTALAERDRINRDAERHARRAEQAEVERDGLRIQVDQVIARNNALRDKLDWAQGELNRIGAALRGPR